ncbi:MAG: glycosyltransferase family 4 protein [Thermoanaerobaculia bacterium]|nr:glycosyltransferase family 4 protein [Thermoanaerobaculia bacterium]
MRLVVDVSKAGAPDGIGSWTRGLVRGLVDHLASADDYTVDQIVLCDLSGALDETAIHEEFGDLDSRFDVSLTQPPSGEPGDVFLASSWQSPVAWHRPVVFVVYDLTVFSHPECHTVDNRIHTLEGCLHALVNDATFLAISEATASELERYLDVPRSEVAVVHPGLESRFAAAPTLDRDPEALQRRLRDRFGLAGGYLLAVGSLEPRKNLERLIDAHSRLDDEVRREHPLVVVGGGGWHNAVLEETLQRAESRGDVHRMGRVTGSDLLHLYQGAAVFAYPSLAEGFGLPVLEAMACGAPVLTSDRSSMPEVVGDAARLVDPDDTEALRFALAELLSDPNQRAELVSRGLRRARDFSWTRAAAEILELCCSASGRRSTDSSP